MHVQFHALSADEKKMCDTLEVVAQQVEAMNITAGVPDTLIFRIN